MRNGERWVHYRRIPGECLCGKETPSDLHGGYRFDRLQVTDNYKNVTCKLCLIAIVSKLTDGIIAVRGLIDESEGVTGLHENGEVALWDELESGGNMEEWLVDFNIAEKI